MNNILRFLPLFFAAVLAYASTSCSNNVAPSFESVPDDAEYAAIVNIDKLAKDAGTDVAAFSESGSRLLESFISRYALTLIPAIAESADLSAVLSYKDFDAREPFMGFSLSDSNKFLESVKEAGWTKKSVEGTETYVPEGYGEFAPCLIIDGNNAWLLGTTSDVKAWQRDRKSAKDHNIAPALPQSAPEENESLLAYLFLPGDNMCRQAIMIHDEPATEPRQMSLTARLLNDTGGKSGLKLEPSQIDNFSPVDCNAFEKYMPEQPAFVAAIGIKPGIDWSGLISMSGANLGTRNQGMLQSLLPYINSLNGTLAIGVGPLTAASLTADEIEKQTLLIYATLEGEKATEAVNEINGNLRQKGLTPTPRADGVYAFTLNGVLYRYTARGNAFLFALNREIDLTDSETQNTDSQAAPLAIARLQLPAVGDHGALCPSFSLTMTPVACKVVFKGNSGFPLTEFANYFSTLRTLEQSAHEASDNYYDDYD